MSLDPTSVRTENNDDTQIQIAGGVTSANLAEVNGSNELLVDVETFSATPLDTNLTQVSGQSQSAVDIANKLDQLGDALQNAFLSDDQLRVDLENNNAGTLAVEQQTPVRIEGVDDGNNVAEVGVETIDVALAGTEPGIIDYSSRALQNVGSLDQVRVDVENFNAGTVTVTDDGSFNATVSQPSHDNLNANANIQVGDTDVSSSNPVPISDQGEPGTSVADYQASSALAAQSSETLNFSISSSTTGRVQHVFVSSEVPFTAEIQKYNGTSATTIAFLNGDAGESDEFVPENATASLYEQDNTGSGEEFRVVATNNNASGVGASGIVHVTFEQTEV